MEIRTKASTNGLLFQAKIVEGFFENVDRTWEAARFPKIISKENIQLFVLCKKDGTWARVSETTLGVLLETHLPSPKPGDFHSIRLTSFMLNAREKVILIAL